MATFIPQFAHDALLKLAEAGYLQTINPATDLPAGYVIVGQITANPLTAAQLAATAPIQHQQLLSSLAASGPGFGWVVQNVADGVAIVAFRGTQSVDDWLHNLDFILAPYQPVQSSGTVHAGFQLYYLTIRNSLLSLLSGLPSTCRRLILTGHSLGAALSELAAPDVLHNLNGRWQPEVQNFAGPRVGQNDFVNIFDVQIDVCFRVVNMWDLVPNVPPALIFEHVGIAVTINGGFTLNELQAHSLQQSYDPGLLKLIPAAAAAPMGRLAVPAVTAAFPEVPLIGRVP
ncbi:MAG: lipase family protein [Verrucomicrobia bacterium]|nr:lipase family protein [Verrucomicrobiota bacterium]MBV8485608.1 lipase family protein [Verrucomicrobiota bacterium]